MSGLLIEVVKHFASALGYLGIAINGKKIISRANFNVETLFD